MYSITKDPSPLMHSKENSKRIEYEALFGDYGYKAVGYDTKHYGALEIAYRRFFSPQFQFHLGVSCELSSKRWDVYDKADGPRIERIPDFRFNLMPGINCFLVNKEQAKIWLSGQAGVQWLHRGLEYFDTKERNKQLLAWQLWLNFEHRICESVNLDWGTGYGTLGLVKIGISYSF